MEVLFQYLVPLLLLPLSCAAVILLHKRSSKSLNIPPGATGWPVVGDFINMALQGPQNFISDRMKRYSPQVFQTCFLGGKMAFFCGPQGNKFLFTQQNKLVTPWFPLSTTKIFLFPEYYENYKQVATMVRSAAIDISKPEILKKCIPVMHSLACDHIEQDWAPNKQVKVFPLSKKYNFNLACKLFLGIQDPADINTLALPFLRLINGLYSVPINFTGTAYRRAVKAGIVFRRELLRIIQDRRKELKQREDNERRDLLSKTLLQNEHHFSDKDIIHNITGLLVASYDTTGTAITFVLMHLAELPHVYDSVLQEVASVAKGKGPGELLSWEDIEKMKFTWNVVRESMRVAPPSQGMVEEAMSDFIFAGFTIPKGWKTFWNVYTTHKDPKYFPEPEKIDPTRFEGSGPIPYTFVPFGGGPQMCPGREYARLVVLVFIYNVVIRFKLEKGAPNEKITYNPTPTPMKGLPLRLQPH